MADLGGPGQLQGGVQSPWRPPGKRRVSAERRPIGGDRRGRVGRETVYYVRAIQEPTAAGVGRLKILAGLVVVPELFVGAGQSLQCLGAVAVRLMRRPEITGFISVSPPANMYDFSFLAPCPSSGLMINGTADRVAPPKDTQLLVEKLHEQKGITITHTELEGAGHFFEDPFMEEMIGNVDTYVRRRLTETTR